MKLLKTAQRPRRQNGDEHRLLVGWKEWCTLPDLHLPAIKAKLDTGARTSSLHAYAIETYHRHGELWVKFKLHPVQRNNAIHIQRSAKVIDRRNVISSTGHKEYRFVIETCLLLAGKKHKIELTLANREKMIFKMLLGREALKGVVIIDPMKAHQLGRLTRDQVETMYTESQA